MEMDAAFQKGSKGSRGEGALEAAESVGRSEDLRIGGRVGGAQEQRTDIGSAYKDCPTQFRNRESNVSIHDICRMAYRPAGKTTRGLGIKNPPSRRAVQLLYARYPELVIATLERVPADRNFPGTAVR
jgi:hypothetical protein